MKRALIRAANREHGNICPIVGCWAAAEQKLIEAMERRGYIAWSQPEGFEINGWVHYGAPLISDAGRQAIKEMVP